MRPKATPLTDFRVQADLLKGRFIAKGYKGVTLESTIQEVGALHRSSLLNRRQVTSDNSTHVNLPFITTYSNQHRDIKRIVKKHWSVLKSDKVLGPHLPETQSVVFRGVPPLGLYIAPNVLDKPNNVSFFHDLTVFFPL